KKAATGSAQRYHTPCTNVQQAINPAIHTAVHHFGGDRPWTCQAKRMVTRPAMVTMNGRPIRNRIGTSEVSVAASSAINQASGRFSHGNADQPTSTNSPTTETRTSASVLQWLAR